MVSNLYVRQANLKVILEVTGSQCNSDRRAVAERLGKTTRFLVINLLFVCFLTGTSNDTATVSEQLHCHIMYDAQSRD